MLIATLAVSSAAGCNKVKAPRAQASGSPSGFDHARLEAAIDKRFGGVGTCVIVAETGSGRTLYRYGDHGVCLRALPPCATFEVAADLVALDQGAIRPGEALKWDGSPQPVSAWKRDADMGAAFSLSIPWWDQQVARKVGAAVWAERLRALDYGTKKPDGRLDGFWLGPSAGGGLAISTEQQADFLSRLFRGRLPVKPASAAAVQALMRDPDVGGDAVELSDKAAVCASQADQSRQVTWWIGRLKTPARDVVFAASLEASSEDALPGAELAQRGEAAFVAAGLWPRAAGGASDAGASGQTPPGSA